MATAHTLARWRRWRRWRRFKVSDIASSITGTFVPPPYNPANDDPYWSSVMTVLHFNGTNGQTGVFTDSGPYNLSVSSSNGMMLTGSSGGGAVKFGDTCLGTGSAAGRTKVGSSNYFYISASADFTIEYWAKKFNTTDYNEYITTNESGSPGIRMTTRTAPVGWYVDNCAGVQSIYWPNTSSFNNAWHHVAYVRAGTGSSNFKLYLDGTERAASSTNLAFSGSGPLVFGGGNGVNPATQTCLDEFRWTNAARYTGSFTPPTAQFPSY